MSVVMIEGFDLYNAAGLNTGLQSKWTVTGTGASMVTGRFSGQCFRHTVGFTGQAARVLPAAYSSFSVGFAFRTSVMTYPRHFFWMLSGSTYQIGLLFNADGSITAGRYTAIATSTALGTSAVGKILGNTWHYIEVECTISDTVGVFKVYVDGSQVLNLTAQDTRNGTPTTVDTVQFGSGDSAGSSTLDFDDVYVTDAATKLGERRVETLYPTSDVSQGFARSAGSTNYTLVDDPQVNGDTDYVQGSTVGDTDTYGLQDLSGTPATIDAIQVCAFAEKTDATTRNIALQVKSGATTSDGGNFVLASSYGKFERLLLTDPNTSAAWTAAGVNALQSGPKVTV